MRDDAHGVHVRRTWLWPLPNRKAHERMRNYGSFWLSSSATGMFMQRPDVIIATSPQLLVGLTGWWLSRVKSVPFIFEVRDLWPESLAAVGMGSQDSSLHRWLGRIAGFLYKEAERIVVVTPAFTEHLVQHWKVPRDKISLVENGVETDLFAPHDAGALKQALGLQDKFVVCYVGTMGMAHGLQTVVEAAARLRTSDPQVTFLLVGEGAEKEKIKALARSRDLDNMLFIDQQVRERIPDFICASDACLVSLRKTELFKTVIPTKMLEFMSCARPVIVGVDGQARKIIEDAQAGIFVEPEESSDLADAIRRLASDADLRMRLGANGRRHILDKFSRRRTAETYIQVLQELTSGQSAAAAAQAERSA
jgi:glycosyltransferase involved in cell wall biosynthesis